MFMVTLSANPLTTPPKKLLGNILYIFHNKVYTLSLNLLVNYNKYSQSFLPFILFSFRLFCFGKYRFFPKSYNFFTFGPKGKNGLKGRKLDTDSLLSPL